MSATEDTGAPNLDCMPHDELLEWARKTDRRLLHSARTLFPAKPARYKNATGLLVSYAHNKASAMYCRERGDIIGAQVYEFICEDIYKRLPAFARW